MYNTENQRNNSAEQYERLLRSIKLKERQAVDAKSKGMHASFSVIMEELSELKRRLRKQQMGGR